MKTYFLIFAVIMSLLFLRQCQTNKDKDREITRLNQNLTAQNDTISKYVASNGNLVTKINGYVFDIKKDKATIQELAGENYKLKGTVAVLDAKIVELTNKKIPSTVVSTSDSTGNILMADSTVYNKNNYVKFYASVPYSIINKKIDSPNKSDIHPILTTGDVTYRRESAMELFARFQEEKGAMKLIVESPNKSIIITDIKGGVIRGEDLPSSMRMEARKNWGFGYSVGAGLGYDPFSTRMMPVIYVGIGINYTPKKIQF